MKMLYKFLNLVNKVLRNIYRKHFRRNLGSGGDTVIFYGKGFPTIRGEQNVFLGESVKLNEFVYLYARGTAKITIGNYSTLSSFCRLITAGYELDKWLLECGKSDADIHVEKSIVIGEHCWVGQGAIILPGVNLSGTNVVVAAGAVVTKSFSESNIILGGIPAQIIKKL